MPGHCGLSTGASPPRHFIAFRSPGVDSSQHRYFRQNVLCILQAHGSHSAAAWRRTLCRCPTPTPSSTAWFPRPSNLNRARVKCLNFGELPGCCPTHWPSPQCCRRRVSHGGPSVSPLGPQARCQAAVVLPVLWCTAEAIWSRGSGATCAANQNTRRIRQTAGCRGGLFHRRSIAGAYRSVFLSSFSLRTLGLATKRFGIQRQVPPRLFLRIGRRAGCSGLRDLLRIAPGTLPRFKLYDMRY